MAQLIRGLFVKQPQVDKLKLDALLSEEHSYNNQVSRHPIEEGEDVNDYIRSEPDIVTIRGIVSKTPISIPLFLSNFAGRYRKAFGDLRKLAKKGTVFDIVTVKRKYKDMAVLSLNISSDRNTGEVVDFTMTCQKIRRVSAFGIDPDILEELANAADLGDASLQ